MEESSLPTAVVTGASSGIGVAVAHRLRDTGHRVIGLDIAPPPPAAGNGEPNTDGDIFADFWICDLTDRPATGNALASLGNQAPAVLVHCAGWTPHDKFLDTAPEVDDRIVDVNFTGTLNAVRPALRTMVDAGRGRIVLIASDAARVGVPGEAVYAAAKAGQIALAKSVAVEVAKHGVTVNVVSPGTTDTPLLHTMYTDDQIQRRVRANPMRRIATASDIANAVEFFVRPESDYITGQVISVNGGMNRVD